jgi:hypothetical protein
MSTDPLSRLYKGKCRGQVSLNNKIGTKTLLCTVVLREALVDTRATGCKTQQLRILISSQN